MAQDERNRLADKVSALKIREKTACVGLDGFVDRVLRVVRKRIDKAQISYINTLDEYGRELINAAGLSLNVEMIPQSIKFGGNGPIMAYAMASLGNQVNCLGAFGKNGIDEVFHPLKEKAALYSFAEPANTDAIEFDDGKVIASILTSMNELSWEQIVDAIGMDQLLKLFEEADLIAMNNWTMLPGMNDIWRHCRKEILPNISRKDRILFFDLADPAKRTEEDLLTALYQLTRFQEWGEVVVSCNLRETQQIADVLGLNLKNNSCEELCTRIRAELGIGCYTLHVLKAAYAATKSGCKAAPGYYTKVPRLSVGGGDNFNAGLAVGLLGGMPIEEALRLGNAVSGYYVRNGASPTLEQAAEFIRTMETTVP